MLRLHAPAKLNLSLLVTGRRGDGFHELVSLVQTVDLCDVVEAEPAAELRVATRGLQLADDENLVLHAARLLRSSNGTGMGASLRLMKRIPVAAGLGGGSSDAAATLRLLDRLWGLGMPPARLAQVGAELGSDVPLFLRGGSMLLEGRGERARQALAQESGVVVLVVPAWELTNKTARVYRELRPNEHSRVEDGERLATAVDSGARIPDDLVRNDLTGPAERVFPKLGELRRELRTVTGVEFLLCGAGPAVFHFSPSPTRAGEIGGAARRLGYPVFVARPLRGPTRIVEVAGRTASTEDHA